MQHEKLNCYQRLLALTQKLVPITRRWPAYYSYLKDQLNRALSSGVLNLAEGNAKERGSKERRHFFRISCGSIAETAACIDLATSAQLMADQMGAEIKAGLLQSYNEIRRLP